MSSIIEIFLYAYRSLLFNKMRSGLTVLGIIIGIAAIVSLISLSEGLDYTIKDMISAFGANNIIVVPGSISSQFGSGTPGGRPTSGRLFENDVDEIESVPGTESISPFITTAQNVIFRGQEITITIYGVKPDSYFSLYEDFFVLREGRYPRDTDKGVAFLGANIADDTFDKKISVGQFIYVGEDKKKVRVIGILEKKGGLEGEDTDNTMIMHFDDAKDLAAGNLAKNEINGIMFSVSDGLNVSDIAQQVELELASAHHLKTDEKDFTVMTSESMLEQIGGIMDLLSLFLGFISSISLIVGGVGVMNTMYMAVLERTREIGTLKALGADDRAVLLIFVIESGLLGMLGGIIGILIGGVLALVVNLFGFHAVVDLPLIAFAISFSFILGVVSGILPARQASKLDPIEALRYE